MEKEFFTVKELAKRWGVSEKRVYQIKDDLTDPLPFHKLGGIRFNIKDILQYEQTHRFPQKPTLNETEAYHDHAQQGGTWRVADVQTIFADRGTIPLQSPALPVDDTNRGFEIPETTC